MTTATFNPTAGLEKANSDDDLRPGDKVIVTYRNPDGEVNSLHAYTREDYSLEFLFDKEVHFLKKAPRVELNKGTFGVATAKGSGVTHRGFVDQDGDFASVDEAGRVFYLGAEDLTDFHEIKLELVQAQAEPPKTEGLIPGVDPLPAGYTIFRDKSGDRWTADVTKESAPFEINREQNEYNEGRSWDNPDHFMSQYAPFDAIR